jgi:hypothetical protein
MASLCCESGTEMGEWQKMLDVSVFRRRLCDTVAVFIKIQYKKLKVSLTLFVI